jgi:hypothetical protein
MNMEKLAKRGHATFVLFTKYYYDDQIRESKVGGACSTHGGDK